MHRLDLILPPAIATRFHGREYEPSLPATEAVLFEEEGVEKGLPFVKRYRPDQPIEREQKVRMDDLRMSCGWKRGFGTGTDQALRPNTRRPIATPPNASMAYVPGSGTGWIV